LNDCTIALEFKECLEFFTEVVQIYEQNVHELF